MYGGESYFASENQAQDMGGYGESDYQIYQGGKDIEKEHNDAIKKRKRIKMAFIAGWVVVAILIIASISVAARGNGGTKPTSSPTRAPTREPAPPATPTAAPTRSGEFRRREIIAKTSSISGAEVVAAETTPQHAATEWMIEDDPQRLEPTDPQFDQRYALATVVFATDDRQTWKLCGPEAGGSDCPEEEERFLSGSSECEWYGVICDSVDLVTKVDLRDNGLGGELVPEFKAISSLVSINLSRNSISSEIPTEFGEMSGLQELHLERNDLSGRIPSSWPPNIEILSLSRNSLSLGIPGEVFTSSLEEIDLSGNAFTGEIPQEMYIESTALRKVDLSSNRLEGTLPGGIGGLFDLEILKLGNNRFEGELSGAIFTSSLTFFDVELNRIEGEIPSGLFEARGLTQFNVGKNRMEGTISKDFEKLRDLEILILSQNNFSGEVPKELGKLSELVVLDVGYTDVEGSMPEDICELLDFNLVYLASDCNDKGPKGGDFECECCTICYPIHG